MADDDVRFLVTGAAGCIGAWTVRLLLDQGVAVVAADLDNDLRRLRLVSLGREDKVESVTLDVRNTEDVVAAVRRHEITHIVHLAGLQVPFCAANPPLGAMVNVVGTVNMFEAIRAIGAPIGLCYASSSAVYGNVAGHPAGMVTDSSALLPDTLYGVYKVANEGTAQIYSANYGIGFVGLRPFVVYGPGRDQGMTSGPTKAMLAAAAGVPFKINFGGNLVLTHAADCALVFIACARAAATSGDAICLNVPGQRAGVRELVATIERVLPSARGLITLETKPLTLPALLGATALPGVIGEVPGRPLEQGVTETITHFQAALASGLIARSDVASS